jgi:hypothetical protein
MSTQSDDFLGPFLLCLALAIFVFGLIVVGQRDGYHGQLQRLEHTICPTHHYVTAASGNVLTINVNGHTFADVRCAR